MATSPLVLWPLTGELYQPQMADDDDRGAVGGLNDWQDKPKCRSVHHRSHMT
jgi:hypothetical protein